MACVSENELKAAFKQVDKDNSNAVELDEFFELLKLLKQTTDKGAAEALFKKLDADNSGSLEFQELVQYFVKK